MNAKFPNGQEARFILAADVELRGRGSGRGLEGYAAVFSWPGRIGDFTETVMPGAFAGSLAANRDILALANHDMNHVLGRTKAGTLKLAEDTRGLHFQIDELPCTGYANDVL